LIRYCSSIQTATGKRTIYFLVNKTPGAHTECPLTNSENRNEKKNVRPPRVQVTCVVSEPESVDESSKLWCFIDSALVIASQVLGHFLHTTQITNCCQTLK